MREYLHAAGVEFDDRNVRQNDEAQAELEELTGSVVVPTLVHGEERLVGFDPDALDRIIAAHKAG